MAHKYRVITTVSPHGKEMFVAQKKVWWFPFWIDISRRFPYAEWAIRDMEAQRRKDTHKSRVVRSG